MERINRHILFLGAINIYLNKLNVPFVYIQHINNLKLTRKGTILLKISDEILVNGRRTIWQERHIYTAGAWIFSITWYLYKCGRSVLDKMLEQRAVVHNLRALKENRNSLPHISGSLPALASENLYLTGVPWVGDAGGTWFILPEILLWIRANKSMGSRGNCTSLNHGSPLRHRVSLVRQLNLSKPQCLHK